MKHLFQSPIKDKMTPNFSVRNLRTETSLTRPVLTILWKGESEDKPQKRTFLLENLDILEEYTLEMLHKHTRAYMDLLNFSQKNMSAKYPFVHRIINDCSYSH